MPIHHRVLQGESIPSLAFRYGFSPSALWDDPANADLRTLRQNPDVLMPGDVVVIPDRQPKEVGVAAGRSHRFRRLGVPARTRLQLFQRGVPRAGQEYALEVGGGVVRGVTDEDGVLESFIPPDARQGRLVIGPDEQVIEIRFGELDPITELTGVQKRLSNLGFNPGEIDGVLGSLTREALRHFQRRSGLPESGEPDEATLAKLLELHDQRSSLPPEPSPSGAS